MKTAAFKTMYRVMGLWLAITLFYVGTAWGQDPDPVTLDIADGGITISADGYKQGDAQDETSHKGAYIITGRTSEEGHRISVTSGTHDITLDGVFIDLSSYSYDSFSQTGTNQMNCPFSVEKNGNVVLTLKNTTTLKAGKYVYYYIDDSIYGNSGILIQENASLTIRGNGSLNVSGGAQQKGNCISGEGSLTIESGTIEAVCPSTSANRDNMSAINTRHLTIQGGTVKATGSVGLGSDACELIQISGGTVVANGGQHKDHKQGPGIYAKKIVISGGDVEAIGGHGDMDKRQGSGSPGIQGVEVEISGGKVLAKCPIGAGAGIGWEDNNQDKIKITISGGDVTAIGGDGNEYGGAGIGGGKSFDILISGGNVEAKGGTGTVQKYLNQYTCLYGGNGIGTSLVKSASTITITGGTVIAIGGDNNWRGYDNYTDPIPGIPGIDAGQNSGDDGKCAVTISGGTVTAIGGSGKTARGAGIGNNREANAFSFSTGTGGNAFIVATSIDDNADDKKKSWQGVIFEGKAGTVYGNPTLSCDADVPTGKTLTIPANQTLTVNQDVTLTNYGPINIEEDGQLVNNGTIIKFGQITNEEKISGDGKIKIILTIFPKMNQYLYRGEPILYSSRGVVEGDQPLTGALGLEEASGSHIIVQNTLTLKDEAKEKYKLSFTEGTRATYVDTDPGEIDLTLAQPGVNDWYGDASGITFTAPTGFEIAQAGSEDYASSFTWATEGIKEVSYNLRRTTTGYIYPHSKTVKLDVSAPALKPGSPAVSNLQATFTLTDAGSGIASYSYSLDGAAEVTENVAGAPAEHSFTVTDKAGQHTLTLKATDVAGNEATFADISFELKDAYVPPVVVVTYYTVTLPSVEGAILTPKAGDHTVEEGYSFRFKLALDAGYDQSVPIVTTDRGETLTADASGRYRIKNVYEDIAVSITGIFPNEDPTANAEIEGEVKVKALDHTLYIYTPQETPVSIYTPSGHLEKLQRITGSTRIDLQAGVYFVRIDGKTYKVVIR